MVRFSCFSPHIQSHKLKKSTQPSFDMMSKMLQVGSQNPGSTNTVNPMSSNALPLPEKADSGSKGDTMKKVSRSSTRRDCISAEIEKKFHVDNETEIHEKGSIRRTRSLGFELDQHGRTSNERNFDICIDTGFSCASSHNSNGRPELLALFDPKCSTTTLFDQDQEVVQSGAFHLSFGKVNSESIFSFSNPQYLEKQGHEDSDYPLYVESAGDSDEHARRLPELISRACSVPNFGSRSPTSRGNSPCKSSPPRNTSFEDLNALCDENMQMHGQERDDNLYNSVKYGKQPVHDYYDSYDYVNSRKDWMVPISEEVDFIKNLQGESSSHSWDQFPSKDFKIKRIEEWVIDLQHCSPVEKINEVPDSGEEIKRGSIVLDGLDTAKFGTKINSGVEAAKRYISSLNATDTSAQLANHGLVLIPFLSAFVSLKVLNLSANSIAKITAGALPRGLHMLNLSKNKISTIEGLRELTRLRVLDVSCNKILRIGHGLAHCSSVKELYLAGNKISDVEGLHRLLKLTILDLRFNKIATSKCLGQLAANYNTLQAIGLEGNPAQKNVGDEQLKKYLQGILPHLAYYNRQTIKTSTLKDSTERSIRLGSGHQFDGRIRSNHMSLRQSSNSSKRGQGVDSVKRSKGRNDRLPSSGTRASHHHHHHRRHHFDKDNMLMRSRPELSFPKSQSAGTLTAI